MLSTYRRAGLVAILAILASGASAASRPHNHDVSLPSASHILGGTSWRVAQTYKSQWAKMLWVQWLLYNKRNNHRATLYLEATNSVKRVVHWTGELGYLGQGYIVLQRAESTVPLNDGRRVPVTIARLRRGTDRELILYAAVTPDGIQAHGTDDLVRLAWNTLRGDRNAYYLIRVSIPDSPSTSTARADATAVLAPALSVLRQDIQKAVS